MPTNLSGSNISDTFQQVLHTTGDGNIYDGTGSVVLLNANTVATASHALFAVSASHEITFELSSSHAGVADALTPGVDIDVRNITASGDISSSGTITSDIYKTDGGSLAFHGNNIGYDALHIGFHTGQRISIGKDTTTNIRLNGHVTASGNISASGDLLVKNILTSGNITASGDLVVTEYIKHKGDDNTAIRFTNNKISFDAGGMTFFAVHDDDSAPFTATVNGGGNPINFRALDENQNVLLKTDSEAFNVGLYYAGNKKLETTAEGVDITGDVSASGDISASGTIVGSNLSGTNTGDITLTGTPDYITISNQVITRNLIDLANDVTGVLESANLDADTAHLTTDQTFSGKKTFSASITASADISASGFIHSSQYHLFNKPIISADGSETQLQIGKSTDWTNGIVVGRVGQPTYLAGHVTASGDISASVASKLQNFTHIQPGSGQNVLINPHNAVDPLADHMLTVGGSIKSQPGGTSNIVALSNGHITASGNISASDGIYAKNYYLKNGEVIAAAAGTTFFGRVGQNTTITGSRILLQSDVTASGGIQASQLHVGLGGVPITDRIAHLCNSGSSTYLRLSTVGNHNQLIEFQNLQEEPDFTIGTYHSDGGFQVRSDNKTFLIIGADDGDEIFASGSLRLSGDISGSATSTGSFQEIRTNFLRDIDDPTTGIDFTYGDQVHHRVNNTSYIRLRDTSQDIVRINEGFADIDFEVHGDNHLLLKTDAAEDYVEVSGSLRVTGQGYITASDISASSEIIAENLRVPGTLASTGIFIDALSPGKPTINANSGRLIIGAAHSSYTGQGVTIFSSGSGEGLKMDALGNMTASGDISASGDIFTTDFYAPIGINDGYHIGVGAAAGKPILSMANSGSALRIGADHATYLASGVNIFTTGSDSSKGLFLDSGGNITSSGNISASQGFFDYLYTGVEIGENEVTGTNEGALLKIHASSFAYSSQIQFKGADTLRWSLGFPSITAGDNDFVIQQGTNPALNASGNFVIKSGSSNVGINYKAGDDIPEKLSVDGNIYTSGDISASGFISSSGIRSNDQVDINSSFAQLRLSDDNFSDWLAIGQSGTVGYIKTSDDDNNFKFRRGSDNTDLVEILFEDERIHISGSGGLDVTGNITASGNISASGTVFADKFRASQFGADTSTNNYVSFNSTLHQTNFVNGGTTSATFDNSYIELNRNITGSGQISMSGTGDHTLGGNLTVHGRIRSIGSDVTIENGSITISGDISGSATSTGSFAHIVTEGDTIEFRSAGSKIGQLKVDDSTGFSFDTSDGTDRKPVRMGELETKTVQVTGKITASGDISASGDIEGRGFYTPTARFYDASANNAAIQKSDGGQLDSLQLKTAVVEGIELRLTGNISASGTISASGKIESERFVSNGFNIGYGTTSEVRIGFQNNTPISFGKSANPAFFYGAITASSRISASGTVEANQLYLDSGDNGIAFITSASTANLGGSIGQHSEGIGISIQPGSTSAVATGLIITSSIFPDDNTDHRHGIHTKVSIGQAVTSGSRLNFNVSGSSMIGKRDMDYLNHTQVGMDAQGDIIRHVSNVQTIPGAIYTFLSNGNIGLADKDSVTSTGSLFMGIGFGGSQNDGLLMRGVIKTHTTYDQHFGGPLWLGDNGSASVAPPSDASDIARIIGYVMSGSTIYFNPDNSFVKRS